MLEDFELNLLREENARLTRALAEAEAIIAELRGDYAVELCMDRDADTVMQTLTPTAQHGDRIRATDTGREFVWRDGVWWEERRHRTISGE